MRRCQHMVEKGRTRNKGLQACRRWLWRKEQGVILDRLTWDVYRCRGGHVTRILVKCFL